VIHFVHFDASFLPFVSFVCVLAAYKSQDPEKIILHTNVPLDKLADDFRVAKLVKILGSSLQLSFARKPSHVYGQAIGNVYHANDVFKIQLAFKEGGILLDQGRD
jgi:hypothetical protein